MRVHIVEDDYAVRDALTEVLSGFGHTVLAFGDGEAFILGCSPRPADIVFVDLGLPGIDGVEVIHWLRELKAPPRIIAISGRPRIGIELMLRGLPADFPLLRKPIAPDALAAMI
ncbi:MAG: response regulator [Salinarimonadaceae bacterium]|nr:MAG: response regulator [Salinarimonadaceae bacterium]